MEKPSKIGAVAVLDKVTSFSKALEDLDQPRVIVLWGPPSVSWVSLCNEGHRFESNYPKFMLVVIGFE